jgi:hypothetical protein
LVTGFVKQSDDTLAGRDEELFLCHAALPLGGGGLFDACHVTALLLIELRIVPFLTRYAWPVNQIRQSVDWGMTNCCARPRVV